MNSRTYQRVALVAALFAAIFATALTAEMFEWNRASAAVSAGMYGGAVAICAALVLGPLVREHRMGAAMLMIGQVFWFAAPALIGTASGAWFGDTVGYRLTANEVVKTVVLLSTFCVASAVAYQVVAAYRRRPLEEGREARALESRAWLVVAFLVVGLSPFVVYGGALEEVARDIVASRASIKPWTQQVLESKPLYVIGRASLVTCGALSLMQCLSRGWRRIPLGYLLAFLIAFFVTYLDSGTRSWTAVLVVAPALVAIRSATRQQRLTRWVAGAPVLLLLLVGLSQAQLAFRQHGFSGATIEEASDVMTRSLDNDYFTETAIAVSIVPARMDFFRESVFALFVTNPIPREWWPSKPYPTVIQAYGLGKTGVDEYASSVTRLPSVVGQFHMSWGIVGVATVAIFYGAISAVLDQLWRRREVDRMLLLAIAATHVWLFLGYRALIPGFHYPAVMLWAVVFARDRLRRLILPGLRGGGRLTGGARC